LGYALFISNRGFGLAVIPKKSERKFGDWSALVLSPPELPLS
jgi:hypothetical protein